MIGIGDMMFGHLVAPEEDVIGGMAGHFTWGRRRCHTIKKDKMDNAVAYATNKTMPAAVMEDLESI